MHGQLAAKLVEAVYKSEREKWIHMRKMVERHVLVFPLNNKTVVQTHALLVSFLKVDLTDISICDVYSPCMTK